MFSNVHHDPWMIHLNIKAVPYYSFSHTHSNTTTFRNTEISLHSLPLSTMSIRSNVVILSGSLAFNFFDATAAGIKNYTYYCRTRWGCFRILIFVKWTFDTFSSFICPLFALEKPSILSVSSGLFSFVYKTWFEEFVQCGNDRAMTNQRSSIRDHLSGIIYQR